jgi:D-alanine-D-alanine ligase
MKSLRLLMLMHEDLVPPETSPGRAEKERAPWRTEFDVCAGLKKLGHEVLKVGVASDLGVIRHAISDFKPHITFNVVEEFHGVAVYDHHVVSYLELLKCPYTGCNPRGLLLAHDKALCKSVLAYHRVRVPEFAVFPIDQKIRKRPRKLAFPLLVKSLTEEGSVGISQASVVHDDARLVERIEFIHRSIGSDAIVERYIDGRELYVGILGNTRLTTLPIWELSFKNLPDDSVAIATEKVKWDHRYQKKVGVTTGPARDLPEAMARQIINICKRAYRTLNLSGYARMDLRLDASGGVWFIEANPNPQLALDEDFADSAEAVGIDYPSLLSRIINLGLSYRPAWRVE